MASTESIKRGLRRKPKRETGQPLMLSTGSSLLNLACTGRIEGGFLTGHYHFLVGDSASGKTWLSLTCFAEASVNPAFDDYRFVYDSNESGALMNIERYFGKAVAKRMEVPWPDTEGGPGHASRNVEEFYFSVDNVIRDGKPFIYVLDSMDCLSSEAEMDKFDEQRKAHAKGKEDVAGSYGDGKAKVNSSNLRRLLGPLQESGSILIIINQTRDNLGALPFEPKKTRSGGHALRFYAQLEIWSSIEKRIRRMVKGKRRQLGVNVRLRVEKNRITGRSAAVTIPILYESGMDDTGSMILYLLSEDCWKKNSQGRIEVTGMGPKFRGTYEEVVERIEGRGMEEDLRELTSFTWKEIEKASKLKRKRRYE